QCSFHMALKIPSSVKVGSRFRMRRILAYSSGFRPWAAISSSVMAGSVMVQIPLWRAWRCHSAVVGDGEGARYGEKWCGMFDRAGSRRRDGSSSRDGRLCGALLPPGQGKALGLGENNTCRSETRLFYEGAF